MKTKIFTLSLMALLTIGPLFAQDRTTVTAHSSEISDNLDLRAVASIFGDSRDLEDFERRLNDPNLQISNLDLNYDNQVDYLRVIESVEGRTHLIIIQSVLGRDRYQDIATIEVEKDRNNRVQVQVVGNVFIYGNNYIYEPIYVHSPVIYTTFWIRNYRPYCSRWFWGYYPAYYYAWTPFPVFRYRSHITIHINTHHHYNYVNYRRSQVAFNMYRGRRNNAYEVQYPERSFSHRNSGYINRYELDKNRNIKTVNPRNNISGNSSIRNENPRSVTYQDATPRNNSIRNENPRSVKYQDATPRNNSIRNENPRSVKYQDATPRNNTIRNENPRSVRYQDATPRNNSIRNENPKSVRYQDATPRNNSIRNENYGNRNFKSETPRNKINHRGSTTREFSQNRNSGIKNNGNSNSRNSRRN